MSIFPLLISAALIAQAGEGPDKVSTAAEDAAKATERLVAVVRDGLRHEIDSAARSARILGAAVESSRRLGELTEAGQPPVTRQLAVEALGHLGSDAASYLLKPARDEADRSVRLAALRGLGTTGPSGEEVKSTLIRAVRDPDIAARLRAIYALDRLGLSDPDVIAAWAEGLEASAPSVRQASSLALDRAAERVPAARAVLEKARRSAIRKSEPRKGNIPSESLADRLGSLDPVVVARGLDELARLDPIALRSLEILEATARVISENQAGNEAVVTEVVARIVPQDQKAFEGMLDSILKVGGPERDDSVLGEHYLSNVSSDEARGRVALTVIFRQLGLPVFERLRRALTSGEPRARVAATRLFSGLPEFAAGAVPDLLGLLRGPGPDGYEDRVRDPAIVALGRVGASALPALLHALNDVDPRLREGAAEGLGKMGAIAAPAVSALVDMLNDLDEACRNCAVNAIGEIGRRPEIAIPGLMHVWKRNGVRGEYVREYSITEALKQFGIALNPWAGAIADRLDATNGYYVGELLKGLGPAGRLAAHGLLRRVEQEPQVADQASEILAVIGVDEADLPQVALLMKQSPYTRPGGNAYRILQVSGRTAIPHLVSLLESESPIVAHRAALALSGFDGLTAQASLLVTRRLEEMLKPENVESDREAAIRCLGERPADDEPSRAALERATHEPDSAIRNPAVLALGRRGQLSAQLAAEVLERASKGDSSLLMHLPGLVPDPARAAKVLGSKLNDPLSFTRIAAADGLSTLERAARSELSALATAVVMPMSAEVALGGGLAGIGQRSLEEAAQFAAIRAMTSVDRYSGEFLHFYFELLGNRGIGEGVRAEALRAIYEVGPRVIPDLIRGVDDSDPEVARDAASVVGRFGELATEAAAPLRRLALRGDPADRAVARSALALVDPNGVENKEESIDPLAARLDGNHPTLLEFIVCSARHYDPAIRVAARRAAPKLLAELKVGDAASGPTQHAARVASAEVAARLAVPVLVAALRSKDNVLRLEATRQAGRLGRSANAALDADFRLTLGRESAEFRIEALRTIAAVDPDSPETFELLKRGFDDPMTRDASAIALSNLGGRALEFLRTELRGGDRSRWSSACLGLAAMGTFAAPAASDLLGLLGDSATAAEGRQAVLRALRLVGDAGAVPLAMLLPIVESTDDGARVEAIRLLGRHGLGAKESLGRLEAVVGARRSIESTAWGCEALGRIGPGPSSVGVLAAAARTGSTTAVSALRALREVRPDPQLAVSAFVEALGRSEPKTVRVALIGLKELGPLATPALARLIGLLRDQPDGPNIEPILQVLAAIGPAARPACPAINRRLLQPPSPVDFSLIPASLNALERIGPNEEVISGLAVRLRQRPTEATALRIISLLEAIGPKATGALAGTLRFHREPSVVEAIAKALWKSQQREDAFAFASIQLAWDYWGDPAREAVIRSLLDPTVPPEAASELIVFAFDAGSPPIRKSCVEVANTRIPHGGFSAGLYPRALFDTDPALRRAAASGIQQAGPTAVALLPEIRRAIANEVDPETRVELVVARWEVDGDIPAVVVELRRTLSDGPRPAHLAALQAIHEVGEDARELVPELIRLLRSSSQLRSNAAWALETVGEPAREATADLIACLNDPDSCSNALNTLVRIDALTPEARAIIRPWLKPGVTSDQRIAAAVALARVEGGSEAIRAVAIESFGDPNAFLSFELFSVLGHEGAALIDALGSKIDDQQVAGLAIDALSRVGVGSPRAAHLLLDSLRKPRSAKSRLIRALSQIGPVAEVALPELRAIMDARRPDSSIEAMDASVAIAKISGEGEAMARFLIDRFLDVKETKRGHAADCLGELGPGARAVLPELVRCFDLEERPLRYGAILAVSAIDPGEPALLPALREMLQSSESYFRSQAVEILSQLPASEARTTLLRSCLEMPDREVRKTAQGALKHAR